jgi:hypothetical protein
MIDELIRVGLVERVPKPHRMSPLVFRLPLATVGLNRANEEPPENPQRATPSVTPLFPGAGEGMSPKRTPREEPHTSEDPNNTKDFTNVKSSSTDSCPHAAILELWDEIMPANIRRPKPAMWRSGRAGYKALTARWREGFKTKNDKGELRYTDTQGGLVWWRGFFSYLTRSHWLINESRQFDLDWVLKAENFRKAVEGNWHD